jgi:hypothetical protein
MHQKYFPPQVNGRHDDARRFPLLSEVLCGVVLPKP